MSINPAMIDVLTDLNFYYNNKLADPVESWDSDLGELICTSADIHVYRDIVYLYVVLRAEDGLCTGRRYHIPRKWPLTEIIRRSAEIMDSVFFGGYSKLVDLSNKTLVSPATDSTYAVYVDGRGNAIIVGLISDSGARCGVIPIVDS